MDNFIKSLSIEQLNQLKRIVDSVLAEKIYNSKEHIIKSLDGCTKNELNSLRRKYYHQLCVARNSIESSRIELWIDCIDLKCKKEGIKIPRKYQ